MKNKFRKIVNWLHIHDVFNGLMISSALFICLFYSRSLALGWVSLSFLLLPALFAFVLTGQWVRSMTFASVLVLSVHLIAKLKEYFYKEIMTFSDVRIIADINNWDTLIHYPLYAVYIGIIFIITVVAFFMNAKEKRYGISLRFAVLFVVILGVWGIASCRVDSNARNQWWQTLPGGQGTFANLLFSSSYMQYSPPRFSAEDKIFLRKAAGMAVEAPECLLRKPDIVVLLQESTVNPVVYDLPGASLPQLSMFAPDEYTRAFGGLRVHSYGGSTWLSEFALFSGLDSRDFGATHSSVFYTVTPHLKTSLIKVLKENGYHTVVLTPFNKTAYHATYAYRDFGVDEILQLQDLGYPAGKSENLWTVKSSEVLAYARKVIKIRGEKPLFLFILTMAEHGPYNSRHPLCCGLENAKSNKRLAHKMSDYIGRIASLNKATEEFSEFLMKSGKPIMFVYFGDHQPNFEESTLNYKMPGMNSRYLTQLMLRDNTRRDNEKQPYEMMDVSLLGGLILEKAGLQADPLFTANIRFRRLCRGRLQDCPDKELAASYRSYIYQTLNVAEKK
jgi:phosphoglycerol transferase MdoB-like AlkP superfamily enzyme